MYLLKNRNANYYTRLALPSGLKERNFPNEVRISLETKDRTLAIDRNLVVAANLRQLIRSVKADDCPNKFRNELDSLAEKLRQHDFCVPALKAPKRQKEISATKPKLKKTGQKPQMLLSLFLSHKSKEKISIRSIQQLKTRITLFLNYTTISISSVNTKIALGYRDHLIGLGKSHKSNLEYLAAIRQFFNWCVLMGVAKENSFEKITLGVKPAKAKHQQRNRWSANQLQMLFSSENFIAPLAQTHQKKTINSMWDDYWIPLVLLHTGARIGEICQLRVSDVTSFDGVLCFSISDEGKGQILKTVNSKRHIPVHQYLIDTGFIKYVETRRSTGKEQIFNCAPTGKYHDWAKNFTVRFSRYLDKIGIRGKNRPTAYGFRHTFIDELQNAGIPENEVADLVGHSKKSMTYGRYGKRVKIQRLSDVVNTLTFSKILKGMLLRLSVVKVSHLK